MAMTNSEKQEAFRKRMYDAGYKRVLLWVPRNKDTRPGKVDRRSAIRRLDELMAGLSPRKCSRIYQKIILEVEKQLAK
jgi:hypothetical protein